MHTDTTLNLNNVQIDCGDIPCAHMLCKNCPLCNDSSSISLKELIIDWVRLKEMNDKAIEVAEIIHHAIRSVMEEEKMYINDLNRMVIDNTIIECGDFNCGTLRCDDCPLYDHNIPFKVILEEWAVMKAENLKASRTAERVIGLSQKRNVEQIAKVIADYLSDTDDDYIDGADDDC